MMSLIFGALVFICGPAASIPSLTSIFEKEGRREGGKEGRKEGRKEGWI
jgi:hypothetical protein